MIEALLEFPIRLNSSKHPPILKSQYFPVLQAFGECVYPVMFGGEKPGQEKFDKLKEVLGWLETFVADDKFAAGNDSVTIADISLLATYSTMKVEIIKASMQNIFILSPGR